MSAKRQHKHELPPQEQLARGVFKEDSLDNRPGGAKRLRRLDSDALDAALFGKLISIDEHTTLEAFRAQLYRAGLVFCPRAGAEVSGTTGQGQFLADSAFHRARRIHLQMEELAEAMNGRDLNTLLGCLTMDQQVTKAEAGVLQRAALVLDEIRNRHQSKE